MDSKNQSYIQVSSKGNSGKEFTIKAIGLKNNKDTKVAITFKCDQNGKKTKFSLTLKKINYPFANFTSYQIQYSTYTVLISLVGEELKEM